MNEAEKSPDTSDESKDLAPTLVESDSAPTPQQENIADSYVQKAKQFWWLYVVSRVAWLIKQLDAHAGYLTALATVAIAILTYFVASYASKQETTFGGQLHVMQEQLNEMKSGAAQTDKLIDANVKLADAAQKSADTADKGLIATQRAWVGTIDANIAQSELTTPIKGNIIYINSGKEPSKFSGSVTEYVYNRNEWTGWKASNEIVTNQQECLTISSIEGFRFAWPSTGFNTYLIHFPDKQIPQNGVAAWTNEIKTWENILAVQGCITYEAFSAIHHTAFCYFYDSRMTDMAHLNICGIGNYVN
jgi:uncharacterized cupin superfamily protein